MQLPSSGVSISMVRRTLNSPYIDLGSLCVDPTINKWSMWKPVRSSSVTMNLNLLKSLKYGLSLPHEESSSYTAAQFASGIYNCLSNDLDYNAELTQWEYLYPTGGQQSPYRLGDWRYYQHQAIEPWDFNNEYYPVTDISVDLLGSLYTWTTGCLQDNQKPGGLTLTDFGELSGETLHYGAMLINASYYLEHGQHNTGYSYNGIYFIAINPGYIEDDEQYISVNGTPTGFTGGEYLYVPFIAFFTGSTTGTNKEIFGNGVIPSSSNWSSKVAPYTGKIFPIENSIIPIRIIAHNEANPILVDYGWGWNNMMYTAFKNEPYYNASSAYVNEIPNDCMQLNDVNGSYMKWTKVDDSYTGGPWRFNVDFYVGPNPYGGAIFYGEDMDSDPYYLRLNLNGNNQLTGFTWNKNGVEQNISLSSPFTLPTSSGSCCRVVLSSNVQQNMTLDFYQTKSSTTPLVSASLGLFYSNNKPDVVGIGRVYASVPGLRDTYITGVQLKLV